MACVPSCHRVAGGICLGRVPPQDAELGAAPGNKKSPSFLILSPGHDRMRGNLQGSLGICSPWPWCWSFHRWSLGAQARTPMASRVNQGLGESIGARYLEIVSGCLSFAESEPTYQECVAWGPRAGSVDRAHIAVAGNPSLAACTHVWWITPTCYSSFMGPKAYLWPLHIHTYTCIIKPETSLKENKEQETRSQTMLLPLPAPFCESRPCQLAV